MLKIDDLANVVFADLSALVIEGVTGENDLIRVTTRTRDKPVPCPVCGTLTGRVHGYYSRTVADVPVDGRRVVISVQGRRLLCPAWEYARQTFREQVPGLLERYQRRTSRLTRQLGAVVTELAGRAGSRLSAVLAVAVSRSTALRLLMRLPPPPPRIPRVLGVDDFALKRRHRYATILTDAETGERIDVLPGRGADALEAWLRSHPGVEIVCRDGSGAYGEAIRRALPGAVPGTTARPGPRGAAQARHRLLDRPAAERQPLHDLQVRARTRHGPPRRRTANGVSRAGSGTLIPRISAYLAAGGALVNGTLG